MAGRAYVTYDQQAVTTPLDSVLNLTGSTTIVFDIFYCAFSCLTDELDDMLQWTIARTTTVGTGDSLTPSPMIFDGTIASNTGVTGNLTAEPTYTANLTLLDIAVNTRSFQQWYAQPGRELASESAANAGIGIGALHGSSTPTVLCTVHFLE